MCQEPFTDLVPYCQRRSCADSPAAGVLPGFERTAKARRAAGHCTHRPLLACGQLQARVKHPHPGRCTGSWIRTPAPRRVFKPPPGAVPPFGCTRGRPRRSGARIPPNPEASTPWHMGQRRGRAALPERPSQPPSLRTRPCPRPLGGPTPGHVAPAPTAPLQSPGSSAARRAHHLLSPPGRRISPCRGAGATPPPPAAYLPHSRRRVSLPPPPASCPDG